MRDNLANRGVSSGLVTFLAEGNDLPSSTAYSRKLHHPTFNSGVTIGRGYDLKERSRYQILHDLISAGLPPTQAKKIAKASHLSGKEAQVFVTLHREEIGEITRSQQVTLFNTIYPTYVRRAKTKYTNTISPINGCAWDNLHPAIKDILVDIIYQGFKGTRAMRSASSNNIPNFIQFLKSTDEYKYYEKGRNRIQYLEINNTLRGTP